MSNQDYKNQALAALKGNWAPAVLAMIVYVIISGLVETPNVLNELKIVNLWYAAPITLAGMLLIVPFALGLMNAYKELLHGDNRVTGNAFRIAFCGGNYLHILWGYILMLIKLFLWYLLLIIPGIIKCFSYALTPYILVDEPELSALQAIKKSRKMMKGHKFDLFWLFLSFIGWIILCILTFGLGALWLGPYMYTSYAAFYEDVKAGYQE